MECASKIVKLAGNSGNLGGGHGGAVVATSFGLMFLGEAVDPLDDVTRLQADAWRWVVS